MKIGFFYLQTYPPASGYSSHGYHLIKNLVKRGHTVISCIGDGNPDCVNYPRSKWGAIQVAREADVLYIRVLCASPLERATLLKLVRPYSLPVVWEVNAPVEELRALMPRNPLIEKKIARENRRRKFFSQFVDAAIGVSDVLKDYCRGYLGIKRSFSIPNGSDPELFDPEKAQKTVLDKLPHLYKVVWAGDALNPWQGVNIIIEVARKIAQISKDIIFIFITRDGYSFPLLENVLVLREVNNLELPHYLCGADLCSCLYNKYDWLEYGFYNSPLKLFDYMAAARPIIASDLGQISQVIKDGMNGILTGNKVDEIVDRILWFKENRQKGEEMGREARREVIQYYNWGRVAEETEEVLEKVLNKKKF
ncbi:MAG: glycosyltransferase family 4 protein [Proteobacteria bacterium]|nr:glycosyltransferase family 4 protein [Pseudomonadota bacterium]